MNPAVDIAKLPVPAQKILDGSAPPPIRQMAAKGVAPGLRPVDALTVLALLAESTDEALAATAKTTLGAIPAPLIKGALGAEVLPGVLDVVAPYYAKNLSMMELIVKQPGLSSETVARCAELANEAVSELIAVNEERLLKHPAIIEKLYMNSATRMSTADRMIELAVRNGLELDGIPAFKEAAARADEAVAELVALNEQRLLAHPAIIEKLYMNPATRMSTADRMIELAVRNGLELDGIPAFKEAAAAIANELIAEPSEEPTPDDILFHELDEEAAKIDIDPNKEDVVQRDEETGDEVIVEKVLPLHAKLAEMSISQKIRRAMLGSGGERMLLVRDKNKLVAAAAVRSPKIQENEIALISTSRNVSDDVLRIIATNKVWIQNHQIKLNLVYNPRTPFIFSARLVGFLRESELKSLTKSKNVSAAIAQAARQQLNRRTK